MDFRIMSRGYISPLPLDISALEPLFKMFLATFLHSPQSTVLDILAIPNLCILFCLLYFFHISYNFLLTEIFTFITIILLHYRLTIFFFFLLTPKEAACKVKHIWQ